MVGKGFNILELYLSVHVGLCMCNFMCSYFKYKKFAFRILNVAAQNACMCTCMYAIARR